MKKYKLPKDTLVEPEKRDPSEGFIDEGDVEGTRAAGHGPTEPRATGTRSRRRADADR